MNIELTLKDIIGLAFTLIAIGISVGAYKTIINSLKARVKSLEDTVKTLATIHEVEKIEERVDYIDKHVIVKTNDDLEELKKVMNRMIGRIGAFLKNGIESDD